MEKKVRVRAVDDIIFECETPPVVIREGAVYEVEGRNDFGIILCEEKTGERYLMDFQTFEVGFEAM